MNKAKSLRKLQFLAKQNEDEEERKMKTNQKRNQLKKKSISYSNSNRINKKRAESRIVPVLSIVMFL